jgi:hypothetical protein
MSMVIMNLLTVDGLIPKHKLIIEERKTPFRRGYHRLVVALKVGKYHLLSVS